MGTLRFSAVAAFALLVGGCRTEGDTVGRTALTRAVIDTTACPEAIDAIATRRCQNMQRCAAKHHQASFRPDECLREVRSNLALELDPSTSCPENVDHRALATCLEAIDKDSCGRTVPSIDHLVACRHSELCARVFPGPLQ